MIERIELKNFTAFRGLALDFSPKINVIIGENGTGKTHLLKTAYGLCHGAYLFKSKPNASGETLEAELTEKLLRLFMPLDDKLGKLHHQGVTEQAHLSAQFTQDQEISATFSNKSKKLDIKNKINSRDKQGAALFIPTKEVLSFMKGFNSLYEKYDLSFDQTYKDICLLLELPDIRPEKLHEKSKWAMEEIKSICGGHFVFYGGGKVTFKAENTEYSANAMAEGFRKAGMLSRLLETGAIQPGVAGPLFWDEPEANLNPKLLKILVQIMLELSRNGQQIILATHDYVLLKWFDLLLDKGKEDHVRFHTLYRSQDGNVISDSFDDYRAIPLNNDGIIVNVIADTFNDLAREQVNKQMGGFGK